MASKPHYSHYSPQNHVKFQDNEYSSPVQEINSKGKQTPPKMNNYTGSRFPNLQSLFKSKSVHNYYEVTPRGVKEDSIPVQESTSTVAATEKEEDINMEASEFIKRRHHNLDLQKFLSMKWVA